MSKEMRDHTARIIAGKIPCRKSTRLRMLSWNIRNLNGDKEDRAISYMTHIIRQFDVTAMYLMPAAKISKEIHNSIIKTMCKEKPHFGKNQIEKALAKIITLRKKYSI